MHVLTCFLRCDPLSSKPLFQREIFWWWGPAKLFPALQQWPQQSAVLRSPLLRMERGCQKEWLRKEKGRKTQHLKHNREQAVLRLVGWETMGGPRGGCCISSELARSQNSCRFRGDTSLVFTLGVTLTFHLSTSVFIKCGLRQTWR